MTSVSPSPTPTYRPYSKPALGPYQLLVLTLAASLGFHALLVFTPIGESKKPPTLEKEEPVTITQKPPAPREVSPTAAKPLPGKKLVKSPAKSTTQAKTSRSFAPLKRNSSVTGTARSSLSSKSPVSGTSTSTVTTGPAATTINSASVSQPPSPSTSAPGRRPTLAASTSISRNPNPTILQEFIKNLTQLRAGFPNYPGAVFQCAGVAFCYTAPASLEKVSAYLSQEFQARKYDLALEVDESERKVYKLTKDDKNQFLSVIANGASTFYLFSDAPYSAQELQSAAATFAEYKQVLAQLLPGSASNESRVVPETFENPGLFYSKLSSPDGGQNNPAPEQNSLTDPAFQLLPGQAPDQAFREGLESGLRNKEFQVVALPSGYGGGLLYEVTKANMKVYLNLVPAKSEAGTVLVTWLNSPVGDRVKKNERFLVVR